MNKTLPSILFTVSLQLIIFNQSKAQEPPRKNDKIILTNNRTSKENFEFVIQVMVKNNIVIADRDPEILQIKSGIIPGKYNNESSYFIFCSDSSIIVRGMYKKGYSILYGGNIEPLNQEEILNKGAKGSPAYKAFTDMHDFGMLFKTQDVLYELANN